MSSVFVARKPLSRVDRGFNRKKISLGEKFHRGCGRKAPMVQYKPRTEKRPFIDHFEKESKLGKRM